MRERERKESEGESRGSERIEDDEKKYEMMNERKRKGREEQELGRKKTRREKFEEDNERTKEIERE
jgi:hypothetical protein